MEFSPRFTVAVLIAVLLLGVLFFLSRNRATLQYTKARPAPEFSLLDYGGREVKLGDFRGKPLLINSWASWCPFCVQELPDFISLQEEFSAKGGSATGGKDIVVIAINRAEAPATARGYTDGRGLTEKLVFLLDPTDSFYQAIGGFSMPETVFVDKDGKILFHKRGPMSLEEMRRRVQDLFLPENNG